MDPVTNIIGTIVVMVTTNFSGPFIPPELWGSVTNYTIPADRMRIGMVQKYEVIEFNKDGRAYSAIDPTTVTNIQKVLQIGVAEPEVVKWTDQRVIEEYATNDVVRKYKADRVYNEKKWYQFWK
jgi:hypothetical protein